MINVLSPHGNFNGQPGYLAEFLRGPWFGRSPSLGKASPTTLRRRPAPSGRLHSGIDSSSRPPVFVATILPELFHIGFAVADIQLVLNRLPDIQLIKPITPGVSVKEFAFIRDPSGLPVELVVEKEGQ